jgi:hypothetical protein
MGAHTDAEQIPSRFHLDASGTVAVVNAILAWLVVTGAVVTSTHWPLAVVIALCLPAGVLVGAVTGAVGAGRAAIAGRVAVAVAVGSVVGELASVLLFSGSIDRRIDEQAAPRSSFRQPPISIRPAGHALRWTPTSSRRGTGATRHWWSRAASTTRLRPARRPASPACRDAGRKPGPPTNC